MSPTARAAAAERTRRENERIYAAVRARMLREVPTVARDPQPQADLAGEARRGGRPSSPAAPAEEAPTPLEAAVRDVRAIAFELSGSLAAQAARRLEAAAAGGGG